MRDLARRFRAATRRHATATVVAVAASLLVAAACQPPLVLPVTPPYQPPPGTVTPIGCDRAAQRIELSTSAQLDPSCTYTAGIDIVGSNVDLDCAGAHVTAPPGTAGVGIEITTPDDTPQHDVTVRNCVVDGFLNGLRVTRVGFKGLAPGAEYDAHDSSITVEDSTFTGSSGVGVYVDAYVTGVTLQRLHIEGAGSTGVYLEAGSVGTHVYDNTIVGNGFAGTGPDGATFTIGGTVVRYRSTGREGIAVDGSRGNAIARNQVSGNSAGGIFLYENCGEDATTNPGQWWPRRTGSDHNVIVDNRISDEPYGVWIGSRMAENLKFLDCSTPSYVTQPLVQIIEDHAVADTVQGNTFDDARWGVRVEDDQAVVTGNTFTGTDASGAAVAVGTQYRGSVLGHPVTGTTITGNTVDVPGAVSPYRWGYGQVGTTFTGNTDASLAAGVAPSFDQAALPPNTQFFMVAAILGAA